MAGFQGNVKKVVFSFLGSLLGMLGAPIMGLPLGLISGQMTAMLMYLLGMGIGCPLGFLFAVWWEWERKLKLMMFVAGSIMGAALAMIVFWLIVLQPEENATLAFWVAFVAVNLAIPALGIAAGRVSNMRLHKDRSLPRGPVRRDVRPQDTP
jgi:hypothetical protein